MIELTPEERKALLTLIAKVQGGVKDVMFLALLASVAQKLEAPPPDRSASEDA